MDASNYGPAPADPQPVDAATAGVSASPFAQTIALMERAGLAEDVLPVIPPDAIVKDKLRPNRGKIPGRYVGGGRFVGFERWSRHVVTAQDRADWRTWPGAGLCIRTAKYPTIDIDVDDADLAAQMTQLVLDRAGPGALVRERPGSSRVAIMVRSDTSGLRKRNAFTLPGDTGVHAVELLWAGQQIVVAGRHPSGASYSLSAFGLDDWTSEDIPCLSGAEIAALYTDLGRLAGAAGGKLVQSERSSPAKQSGPEARLDPYGAVMRAVCLRRADWATRLFNCDAGPPDREWRRSAVDLLREGILDEDLGLYPHSIYDFGTGRSHTPVSLIHEFGHVEADGEIIFGGSPEYGPRGRELYAVVGEGNSTVRRPSEVEAFAWLVRCLDGPAVPPGAPLDIMLSCLAAAVGLDWTALRVEDARSRGAVTLDAEGVPLPEVLPETWGPAQRRENIGRIVAKRALEPAGARRWQEAWGLDDDDAELSSAIEFARDLARAQAAPATAQTPAVALQLLSVVEAPASPRVANCADITSAPDPQSIPLRRHIIYPRCPAGELLCTVAMPGASKSTLGLHDGLVIASGEERILRGENSVSPERLHQAGPVLIYEAEDPLAEMKRRTAAMMRHHGVATLRHTLRLLSGAGSAPLWIARRNRETGALIEAEGAALLREMIVNLRAVYVVLGPFAGLAEGMDENSAADTNFVMQILANIATGTGACVNVIHHTSKSGGGEAGDMNAARGSSAIAAKARAVVTLNTMPEAEARGYGLTARNHVVLTYAKVSHGPRPDGGIILRRDSAPVGNSAVLDADPREPFEMSAQAMLRAEGDHAPVLSVVALRTAELRQAAREQRRIGVEDGVTAAVLDVLGGVGQRPLADILSDITAALHARRVIRGSAPNTVREHLRGHLGGSGRVVVHDGQNVRLRLAKAGRKPSDPWMLIAEPASEESKPTSEASGSPP